MVLVAKVDIIAVVVAVGHIRQDAHDVGIPHASGGGAAAVGSQR